MQIQEISFWHHHPSRHGAYYQNIPILLKPHQAYCIPLLVDRKVTANSMTKWHQVLNVSIPQHCQACHQCNHCLPSNSGVQQKIFSGLIGLISFQEYSYQKYIEHQKHFYMVGISQPSRHQRAFQTKENTNYDDITTFNTGIHDLATKQVADSAIVNVLTSTNATFQQKLQMVLQ